MGLHGAYEPSNGSSRLASLTEAPWTESLGSVGKGLVYIY